MREVLRALKEEENSPAERAETSRQTSPASHHLTDYIMWEDKKNKIKQFFMILQYVKYYKKIKVQIAIIRVTEAV